MKRLFCLAGIVLLVFYILYPVFYNGINMYKAAALAVVFATFVASAASAALAAMFAAFAAFAVVTAITAFSSLSDDYSKKKKIFITVAFLAVIWGGMVARVFV